MRSRKVVSTDVIEIPQKYWDSSRAFDERPDGHVMRLLENE